MMWQTHAIVGANAAWIAVVFSDTQAVLLLLIAGAFGGLLPDIDASAAKVHFLGRGIFGIFRGVFQHRGFFHSLLAISILFIVSVVFLTEYHPLLPFALTIGYLSHPIIDSFNHRGVLLFFPLQWDIHLLPHALRTQVKGKGDYLYFILGFAGVMILLFQLYSHGVFDIPVSYNGLYNALDKTRFSA